jgi:hypothetical protein
VTRLRRNRRVATASLRAQWSSRYGQAQGKLRGVAHPVLVVKDGRRYGGPTALTRTPRAVKAPYAHRQQIAATCRLLKQEVGWGSCSCQNQPAQWAHLHLGWYALVLTQQAAWAQNQTLYAFRQSLFVQSIPQNPSALQEFALAA